MQPGYAPWPAPSGWGWGPPPLPRRLPYTEGSQAPDGYHLETGVRTGVIVLGASLLGTAYGISLGVAVSTGEDDVGTAQGSGALYIPFAGPFVLMAQQDYGGQFGGLLFLVLGLPLLIDGLAQVSGATLLIVGAAVPRKYYERNDLAAEPQLRVGLPATREPGRPPDHRGGDAAKSSRTPGGLTLQARF